MYVERLTFVLSLGFVALTALNNGFADEPASDDRAAVPKGKISVHLNGQLIKSWKQEKDLNGGKPTIIFAGVNAGGTQVVLDWNDCPVIHDELAAFHEGGGVVSGVYAEVTGEMLFKPWKELRVNPVDATQRPDDELCPVVVIETLHIRVEPRIPSRDRKPVRSTTFGKRRPSTE